MAFVQGKHADDLHHMSLSHAEAPQTQVASPSCCSIYAVVQYSLPLTVHDPPSHRRKRTHLEPSLTSSCSKRQYDRKFKAWGVSKYTNAAEKDRIINSIGVWAFDSPRTLSTTCQLNIEPQLLHKAARHFKARNGQSAQKTRKTMKRKTAATPSSKSPSPTSAVETIPRDVSSWMLAEAEYAAANSVSDFDSGAEMIPPSQELTLRLNTPSPSANFVRDEDTWSWVDRETWSHSNAASSISSEQVQAGSTQQTRINTMTTPDRITPPVTIPVMLDFPSSMSVQRFLKGLHAYVSVLADQAILVKSQLSSEPQSLSGARFWSELRNGIYLLKVGSDLAWCALHNAGNLLDAAFREPHTLNVKFVREILLTLSPTNTRISPDIRTWLLQLLRRRSYELLGTKNPVTIIATELLKDGNDQEVSERGLRCCVEAIYANRGLNDSAGIALQVECAIIKSHRRSGDLELAAAEALSLYRKTRQRVQRIEDLSSDATAEVDGFKTQTRLAATELAHVRMDQRGNHYDEAIQMSLFALTGTDSESETFNAWPPAPASVPGQIEDKAAISTAEDLAKICHELAFIDRAKQWLVRAEELAVRLLSPSDPETVIIHIREKLRDVEFELRYSSDGQTWTAV